MWKGPSPEVELKKTDLRIDSQVKELQRPYPESDQEKNQILCQACRHPITDLEHILAVNNRHRHTFQNPAGISFEIGCFSRADGCITYGQPTSAFTWFAGFSWCLALCGQCFSHLGWFYQSGKQGFFGLILKNLIESAATH